MKTADLIGPALDWAVAKCEGHSDEDALMWATDDDCPLHPSTNWSQGGPIIEREINTLIRCKDGCNKPVYFEARAGFDEESVTQYGPTPLVAAMRCFVASRLGNEIEVPDGLA